MTRLGVEIGPEETYHPDTDEVSTQPIEESSGTASAYICPNKDCPSRKMFD